MKTKQPQQSPEEWEDPSTAALTESGSRLMTEKKFARFTDGVELSSGERLAPLTVAYETFGKLSDRKDNAILIVHALTGDCHCAGYYSGRDGKPGWWDPLIGPGKAFDTNKYFIICSNSLGGCQGTTGPASINPATGRQYNLSYPVFTIRDIVSVQKKLVEHLGIERLLCVSGGSLGGMNTLDWAMAWPGMVSSIIPVSTSARLSPQGIAFSEVERQAIVRDPKWKHGEYDPEDPPADGLAVARMIAHITYLSQESMQIKFGRRRRKSADEAYFGETFEIESYLQYQGAKFVERFDANSYIYLTKAMDFYDVSAGYSSLEEAVKIMNVKSLFISFRSDWLFTPQETGELVDAMRKARLDVEFHEIESAYGHDAFLVEYPKYSYLIERFLERIYRFYNR